MPGSHGVTRQVSLVRYSHPSHEGIWGRVFFFLSCFYSGQRCGVSKNVNDTFFIHINWEHQVYLWDRKRVSIIFLLSPFLIHTLIPWLKSGFLKSTVSRKPTHRSIFAFQFASPFATQVQPLQNHFSIKQSVLCLILMSSSKNCNTSPPCCNTVVILPGLLQLLPPYHLLRNSLAV